MTHETDFLVIGAGVVGSSVAWHLARLGATRVRVVDFDLEGVLSSSELNAGAVRATFGQSVNIELSKLSIEYFATVAERVGYRPVGYTWLHTPEMLADARKRRELQLQHGWQVEEWDVAELRRRLPFIDKTDDLAGAMFAPRDGLVNPNTLKVHFREEAKKLGVKFDDRRWVRSAKISASGEPVQVDCEVFPPDIDVERKKAIFSGEPLRDGAIVDSYRAKHIINCAGPWAPKIAEILGYTSPSVPVRRQVCLFDCRDVDLSHYGMIVDTSGVYFHPEAMNGLAGFANRGEVPGVNFEYDGEAFFQEQIWAPLYERSTAFERLKHVTGWAGLYEVSPDESAIIGEAIGLKTGNGLKQIFEAHSFSGHGVMQAYSAGLCLAELVVKGRYETLDISSLSARRFEGGKLLHEAAVI